MNYLKVLTIGLIAVLFVGCWGSAENTNKTAKENTSPEIVNTSNSQKNENPDVGENETSDVSRDEPLSEDAPEEKAKIETFDPPENKDITPTETLKAYNLASINKNPDKVKNLISKGSIHLINQRAKEEGLSFNKMIIEGKGPPAFETTKISNEKISGNTAVVEIKFADRDKVDKVPFVKEDGKWKIDFVKFFKDAITEINS